VPRLATLVSHAKQEFAGEGWEICAKFSLGDQSSGHNVVKTQSCEIVDWEEHFDDISHVIRQKCRRAYPAHYCLLVLARNGKNVDFEIVVQEIKKMQMPFAELWIPGRLSIADMTMLRVISDVLRVDFNISLVGPIWT
jgi:hypothetical protein